MGAEFHDIVVKDTEILELSEKTAWDKVVAQLSKDLVWEGVELDWNGSSDDAYQQLYKMLNGWIAHYMERNAEVLAQALYRVDVPEQAIAMAEYHCPELMPSEIMAHAILRRTIQKIILRQRYSSGSTIN